MVLREGHLPGLQRRVQGQRGEAVITGDVLLKTAGEGSRENTVWLVGTIPGLLIRRLANTTCALAVSLTPCLLAKPLRESREPSRWWGGRCPEPSCRCISSRAHGALPGPLEMALTGSVGEEGSVLHIVPSGQVRPSRRATCCPISRNEVLIVRPPR